MTALAMYAAAPIPGLQLHVAPGDGAHVAVFGWDVEPDPVDAGPPPAVQELLAHALVSGGTLVFLDVPRSRSIARAGWAAAGDDHWLHVPPSFVDRLRGRVPPWFFATQDPARARRLFDGEVSWDQQRQVGLLVQGSALPALTRRHLVRVLAARGAALADLDLPPEVSALVLPAAGGDFLEVAAREPATLAAVRDAIVAACAQRGVAWKARD